jgi:hypothetical protein
MPWTQQALRKYCLDYRLGTTSFRLDNILMRPLK